MTKQIATANFNYLEKIYNHEIVNNRFCAFSMNTGNGKPAVILQIQNLEGKFVDAIPVKDAVIINIGNILQLWTKGKLKSTVRISLF